MRLYVDPGLRACGVALFDGRQLVAAGFPEVVPATGGHMRTDRPDERAAAWLAMRGALHRWLLTASPLDHGLLTEVCIELPQVLDRMHQKARKRGTDANDLIHLAAVVATICAEFPPQRLLVMLPHEWKGTMPKDVMHARAREVLAPAELAALPKLPKSKLHNVLDAVCMGLVLCGRLRSGGLGAPPDRAGLVS